jgi:hypothetical protein
MGSLPERKSMSRRPASSIAREWLRLIDLRDRPEAQDEVRAAWQTLWRNHVEGDRLAQTDVDDATLICSFGYTLAMLDGNPGEGLRRIERWFEHPQARNAEYPDWPSMLDYAARCRFALGDEAEAIAICRQLLAEAPRQKRRLHRAMVRSGLRDCCRQRPGGDVVPVPVAAFARELVLTFPVRKIIARNIRPGRTTYGELDAALAKTGWRRPHPRHDRWIRRDFMRWRMRERLRKEREERNG